MATMTPAMAVLEKALARPDPTPSSLLRALRTAGYTIERGGPAWMPTTPASYALVTRAAHEYRAGFTPDQIADRMRRSKRMVDRYLAAAQRIGLLSEENEHEQERQP
ncbi:hypothetical protein AB0J43_02735 [Nonomuraea fuscirosea]